MSAAPPVAFGSLLAAASPLLPPAPLADIALVGEVDEEALADVNAAADVDADGVDALGKGFGVPLLVAPVVASVELALGKPSPSSVIGSEGASSLQANASRGTKPTRKHARFTQSK